MRNKITNRTKMAGMRNKITNRTQMAGKLVRMVHILLIEVLTKNVIFVMKLIVILQQLVQEEQKLFIILSARNLLKQHQRKGFKSSEEKDIVFIVYSLEHNRAVANTEMVNAKEISVTKTHHMTNIKPRTMFWYVMSTEEIQKMNSFF